MRYLIINIAKKKKIYYSNLNVFGNSRIKNKFPDWMIERVIILDKYDSMIKYGNHNFINFFKNKYN